MAGYGQFTGYEPAPNGGYLFQRANGSPLLFAGPEAENLKSRLDAYNTVNQPKVAGPGGPLANVDQVGGYAPTPQSPPTPAEVAAFREQMQGAPPPEQPKAQGPGGELGYGMFVGPDGQIYERKQVAGTRGVTQEDLKKQSGTGTPLARSVSETQQGGMEGSQDYLDARAAGVQAERDLLANERSAAETAATNEAILANERFETQKRMMGEEQARIGDLQARVAREEDLKNKAFAEYTSSKVDPNRIFADPGRRAMGALAAGLGAYAATIAKTPNFAQQIIDQAIDRDIRSQEAAIRLKGDKANNLLADLRKSGMDLEQARAAARGIQLQSERAQLEAAKARNAIPAMAAHYEKLDMALQNGLIEANEAYRQATIGKTTRTTNSVVEYPRAGSAGGTIVRPVGDQLGVAQKLQGLQKGEADINKTNRDAAKGPTASPEKRQAFSAAADASNLEQTLKAYDDDYVPPVTENRNIVGRAVEGAIDTVAGKGAGARATLNEKERRSIQDYADAQQTLGALASVLGGQGALSGPERDAFMAGVAPGATMGEIKRAVAKLRSRVEAKATAADAAGEAGGSVVTK